MIGRAAVVGWVFSGCGAALPLPTTLTGRVVDEHGAPIAGADVFVCTYGCAWSLAETPAVRLDEWSRPFMTHTTSAADGHFSMALPPLNPQTPGAPRQAVVTAAGHAVVEQALAPREARAQLRLPTTAPVDLGDGVARKVTGTGQSINHRRTVRGVSIGRLRLL